MILCRFLNLEHKNQTSELSEWFTVPQFSEATNGGGKYCTYTYAYVYVYIYIYICVCVYEWLDVM